MGWIAKNIEKPLVFIGFWEFWDGWKGCLRHLGGYLGQCCLEDWIFRRIFRHVGAKIVNKMGKMATKRRKMGVRRAARNFDSREEQGAGSLKRLELLVELMHWRENLIARRVP